GLPAEGRLGVAVAAQAELLHGPAADPARQSRRRGAELHQNACGPGGLAGAGRGDDDDAVIVAVGNVARYELHPAEAQRDVSLPGAGLLALTWVGAERLDADLHLTQRRGVADRAVHDQPGPLVGPSQLRDQVADQRGVQRGAAVDHQHAAVAGRRQDRLQQSIVLRAADRGDRPGELRSRTELAELNVAAADVGPDIVYQIGRRPEDHSHRAMLVIVAAELTDQQYGQQADRDRHRERERRPAARRRAGLCG